MIKRNNLRKLRRMADLTQESLAKAIGTTRETIANWETGRCQVSDIMRQKIAVVLNLPEQAIFPYWEI